MFLRSFSYWLVCSVAAVIAVGAAEPSMHTATALTMGEAGLGSVVAVPESGREFLLFVGIMAMAFTYRCAWLSWKRNAQE
ncbi:hypothetical protein [Prosthecobacter sp.]|uniref:hypothetical protein n=1 Tax=Prosthecobacter sp. TaxID=1965333 RepID=UPI003784EEE9